MTQRQRQARKTRRPSFFRVSRLQQGPAEAAEGLPLPGLQRQALAAVEEGLQALLRQIRLDGGQGHGPDVRQTRHRAARGRWCWALETPPLGGLSTAKAGEILLFHLTTPDVWALAWLCRLPFSCCCFCCTMVSLLVFLFLLCLLVCCCYFCFWGEPNSKPAFWRSPKISRHNYTSLEPYEATPYYLCGLKEKSKLRTSCWGSIKKPPWPYFVSLFSQEPNLIPHRRQHVRDPLLLLKTAFFEEVTHLWGKPMKSCSLSQT